MAHRLRGHVRYVQKELDLKYSTALRLVLLHIDEAAESETPTKPKLVELIKADLR